MLLYVQWTKAAPEGWVSIDLTDPRAWRNLAKKAEPSGGEAVDNSPGWPFALCLQGIDFSGFDHYSAGALNDAILGKGVRVIVWNDDPEQFTPLERYAMVWDLYEPAPDPSVAGGVNTRQKLTVYTDDPRLVTAYAVVTTTLGPVVVRPWSEFVKPREQDTKHGIQVSDQLAAAHTALRVRHGWREWVG